MTDPSPAGSGDPRPAGGTNPEARGRRGHHRRWSIAIGRVSGIQIRVHATFLLIVLLFWLGSAAPGGLGVVSGMLWLALIFTSVTVHELSHSLVARRNGVGVEAIVLLPIGGVSELEEIPENPRVEFAIAVVGPLTSLGLGVAAAVAGLAWGKPLWPPDLAGGPLLPRLAWLNVILAGFNLLPAFPLDGGRVFRALLERREDRETATHRAARAGRGLALGMIAAGVLWNPWLLVIGVFVHMGASAEEAATVVHERLQGLTVRQAMAPVADRSLAGLPVISPEASLEEALELFGRAPTAVVVEGARVIGLLEMETVAELLRSRAPGNERAA